jgi:PAT family beta-lactamase induction signal transducer AmpG
MATVADSPGIASPAQKRRSPWTWVPSLYFAQGIPYVVVMTVSVVMYKKMGISNTDIALYTSWLYLPWVLKPLWSPFVDMVFTKRSWIVWLQMVLGLSLGVAALAVPMPEFLQFTLVVFGLMAFSSATHDIAADGFYMLSLDQEKQAAFVGVRSTFYRIAMWFGPGPLVVLAGLMEPMFGIPRAWAITIGALGAILLSLFVYHFFLLPRPAEDRGSLAGKRLNVNQVAVLLGGFLLFILLLVGTYLGLHALGSAAGMSPVLATVSAIVVQLALLIVLLRTVVARRIEKMDGGIESGSSGPLIEFLRTFVLFLKKENIWAILAFLLFFRFAEAQLVKLVQPFLLDPREIGGLGLSTSDVGIAYGTVGMIALTAGGLLGGYLISKKGLRWWLWPMVIIMHFPDLAFVYLSQVQPENFAVVCAAVGFEQFGYGFGFTAYMMFMIYISQGAYKTAHYALCTGFMALSMMLPGMFCGWLQETIGYQNFFLWVILSTIPGFVVTALVKIPEGFGRKQAE